MNRVRSSETKLVPSSSFRSRLRSASSIPLSFAAIFSLVAAIGLAEPNDDPSPAATSGVFRIIALLWIGAAIATMAIALAIPHKWTRKVWGTAVVAAVTSIPISVTAFSLLDEPFWEWSPSTTMVYLGFALAYGGLMGVATWFGEIRPNSPGARRRAKQR